MAGNGLKIPIARVNLDQFNGLGREGRRNGEIEFGGSFAVSGDSWPELQYVGRLGIN